MTLSSPNGHIFLFKLNLLFFGSSVFLHQGLYYNHQLVHLFPSLKSRRKKNYFLYCGSSFIDQRRILLEMCKRVYEFVFKKAMQKRIIISQGVKTLLLIFESNRNMLKRLCRTTSEKERILPCMYFYPLGIITASLLTLDTQSLFGSLWGLGVMHPRPTREEKKQHIGAQGTGVLTDEGLGCGWALKTARGFYNETRRTLEIF